MQGVGFTENITVLTGEQVSPNLEQASVPKKKNKAPVLRACTIFHVLNKIPALEFPGVWEIDTPTWFLSLEGHLCCAQAVWTLWQTRSYSSVSGRQSLCSCFLQLGLSTSLSGKYYWLIKANCWQTPDSLRGQGEEPGCREGCDGWGEEWLTGRWMHL